MNPNSKKPMESLPPIPTPAGQRWREFRIRILPMFMFVFAVAGLIYIWNGYVAPSGIVGEVEAVTALVTSVADGQVLDLTVDRFEPVKKGETIGTAARMDPELMAASLASISADLQVLRARMMIGEVNQEQQLQKLRLDALSERVLLAVAKANFEQATNEFQRVSDLFKLPEPLETKVNYDLAKARRDSLQGEIEERTKLIKEMEASFNALKTNPASEAGKDPISLALAAKDQEFQLAMKPVELKAPIDGVVTAISKRPGERLIKGDLILTISSPRTDRIIGYLRQPINDVPTTNDTMIVRSRAFKRTVGTAQILKVGAQLVPINPLLLAPDGKRQEVGLPIMISVPTGMRLSPGEYVDMTVKLAKK
jgi:multidrug resistance efflux pump